MGSAAGSDGRQLDLASHSRTGGSVGTIVSPDKTATPRRSKLLKTGGGRGCGTELREHCGPEHGSGAS